MGSELVCMVTEGNGDSYWDGGQKRSYMPFQDVQVNITTDSVCMKQLAYHAKKINSKINLSASFWYVFLDLVWWNYQN